MPRRPPTRFSEFLSSSPVLVLAAMFFSSLSVWGAAPAAGTATAAAATGPAAHGSPAGSGTMPRLADPSEETTHVKRPDFEMDYPTSWKEDTQAKDYDPNTNFMLLSSKNSSVQFIITNRADDPKKLVESAVRKIDGVQITTLSRSNLSDWGNKKGVGQYLKGKIVDSFPGGIKVFCFISAKHNVLVIETTFSDDLRDTKTDIDIISNSFKID